MGKKNQSDCSEWGSGGIQGTRLKATGMQIVSRMTHRKAAAGRFSSDEKQDPASVLPRSLEREGRDSSRLLSETIVESRERNGGWDPVSGSSRAGLDRSLCPGQRMQ